MIKGEYLIMPLSALYPVVSLAYQQKAILITDLPVHLQRRHFDISNSVTLDVRPCNSSRYSETIDSHLYRI